MGEGIDHHDDLSLSHPPSLSRPTSRISLRKPTRVSSTRSSQRSPRPSRLHRRQLHRGMSRRGTITISTLSGATSSPSPSPCSPSFRTWGRPALLDRGTVITPLHPLPWNPRHKMTHYRATLTGWYTGNGDKLNCNHLDALCYVQVAT